MPAVDPSARVDWQRLAKDNPLEALAQLRRREHCSGLVRVTDDYGELYFAHSSFFTFGNMLRIYKHYDVPADGSGARRRLSFSSYPGYLESLDDFYGTNQLSVHALTPDYSTDIRTRPQSNLKF